VRLDLCLDIYLPQTKQCLKLKHLPTDFLNQNLKTSEIMGNGNEEVSARTTALAGGLAMGLIASWFAFSYYRKAAAMEEAYWAERRGRTRVEQEMRRLAEVQLNTSEGFFVQPVGVVESCYRQCVGTPRQGMLVPSSRAAILLTSNMSAEAFDGLEDFSHVWLSFKFHLNTNSLKEARAFEGVVCDLNDSTGSKKGKRKFTFTAKITPPMLKEKKGVLATRSPHRPNPIGVTLAKIDRIDKKTRRLYVTACDLVNGTPILDIKPYVPMYDSITPEPVVPKWIQETIDTRNVVTVHPSVPAKVQAIAKKLKQYKNDGDMFLKALVETLEADVRSKFQTQKRIQDSTQNIPVDVPFDEATVFFLWVDLRTFEIVDVILTPKNTSGCLTTAERAEADIAAIESAGGDAVEDQ
jgi:tRNA (Thr-GGU) A37 N-methylase